MIATGASSGVSLPVQAVGARRPQVTGASPSPLSPDDRLGIEQIPDGGNNYQTFSAISGRVLWSSAPPVTPPSATVGYSPGQIVSAYA